MFFNSGYIYNQNMKNFFTTTLLLAITAYTPFSLASINTQTDPETQRQSWVLSEDGFELEIAQLLPDQTRAFYMARGFSAAIAESIATNCMMQTVAKNIASKESGSAITVLLKEWQIKTTSGSEEKLQSVKLKETWNTEWKDEDITPAARIAFRWATFPTEQTFEPSGDYNWGTTSFGLAPASTFDLNVIWHQGDKTKSTWIKNIRCAEDR